MSFLIFKYQVFSYIFLTESEYYDKDSQDYILLCNRLSEICEIGLAPLPLYVLIPGADGNLSEERPWRLLVYSTDEKDAKCDLPFKKEGDNVVPYVLDTVTRIKFDENTDTSYEYTENCTLNQKGKDRIFRTIKAVPPAVDLTFVDMS